MLTRRLLLLNTALLAGVALPDLIRADTALGFDPEGYQTLRTQVALQGRVVSVTYRFWRALPYVARAVLPEYQCLNLSVPVEIDGVAVDARGAAVLFANAVGGYMPSAVAQAQGVGEAQMRPPAGMRAAPSGSAAMMQRGAQVSLPKLALASGMVVVEPGARGRGLVGQRGSAPAAIVDLKAALRYLRLHEGVMAGDMRRIIATGSSAGGALSALLGASADHPDYAAALAELGAAETSDALRAVGSWCPITDLDHADMAYEWCWGGNPLAEGALDRNISQRLAAGFAPYQASLGLKGRDGTPLTAAHLPAHLLDTYLRPEASAFLAALPEAVRQAYLTAHPQIGFADGAAQFDWPQFLAHVGPRKKPSPAFDAFDRSTGENALFADSTGARHFTALSAEHVGERLAPDLPTTLRLMNPMPYLAEANPARVRDWWLRVGAKDSDSSLSVLANLDARLRGLGDRVNTRFYWDEGHGANLDAEAFIAWALALT